MHPIKMLINYGIKVVICSDDPGLFNLKGVSHDFFFAAIGSELGKAFVRYSSIRLEGFQALLL